MATKEGHSLDIILFICDNCDMTSTKRIPRHYGSNNEWRPLSADQISSYNSSRQGRSRKRFVNLGRQRRQPGTERRRRTKIGIIE